MVKMLNSNYAFLIIYFGSMFLNGVIVMIFKLYTPYLRMEDRISVSVNLM